MRTSVVLALTFATLGCWTGPNGATDDDDGGAIADDPGEEGGAGAVGYGLPCDVKAVLVKDCVLCHGTPPTQGATLSLASWADLTAPSKTQSGKSVAEACVLRMKDTTSPMPPGQPASAADVAVIEKWIGAGMPKGACGGAAVDGGVDPYNTPPRCTSNTYWTGGNTKSATMQPGLPCVTCHALGGKATGKTFDIAGTVYPSAHEPDNCNGGPIGVTVVITDANNQDHSLAVNAVGNFYHADFFGFQKFPTPYRARVVAGGKTRAMTAPQTDGNCNVCHTQTGTQKAPGRIVAP